MALPSYDELVADELPSYESMTQEELPSYEELTAPQMPPAVMDEALRATGAAMTSYEMLTMPSRLDWSAANEQKRIAALTQRNAAEDAFNVANAEFEKSSGTYTDRMADPNLNRLEDEMITARADYDRFAPEAAPSYESFAKSGGTADQYSAKFGVFPEEQDFTKGEIAAGRKPAPGFWETAAAKFASTVTAGVAGAAGVLPRGFGTQELARNLQRDAGTGGFVAGLNRGALGDVGRGVGAATGLLAGNPAGKVGVLTGALRASADARSQTLASGGSEAEADTAALHAFRDMGIYMGVGAAASKLGGAIAGQEAGAIRRGLTAGATGTAANIGTSAVMSGGDYGLENLTQDVLFGVMGGIHAAKAPTEALRPLSPDESRIVATRGMDALDVPNEGRLIADPEIREPIAPQVAPTLKPGQQQGDLLTGRSDDAFNLAGEVQKQAVAQSIPAKPPSLRKMANDALEAYGDHNSAIRSIRRQTENPDVPREAKERAKLTIAELEKQRAKIGSAEVEYRQQLEGELRQHENEGGYELLSTLKSAGGLPTLSKEPVLTGEMRNLWQTNKGKVLSLVRKGQTKGLDAIRRDLNERGFWFDTPDQMLSAVAEAVGGKRIVAYERELGPGAANIEEFGPQKTVGSKNASVDAQRAERGLPPLASEARKSDPEAWDNMERAVEKDPDLPYRIVDDILSGKKKQATDEEQLAILQRMIDLRNRREAEAERARDPSLTPEEQQAHVDQFDMLERQLDATEQADRAIGTAQGRALRARRIMANEDFTLATMEARERKAKGEPLTPEETQRIKSEHDEIARLAKEQGKREAALELEAERKSVEEKIAEVGKFSPGLLERARKWIEAKESQIDAGRERMRILVGKIMGKTSANPLPIGEAFELTKILANEALVKLGRAGVDLAKFSADMVSQFGDAVSPYLKKAWEMAQREWNGSPAKPRKKNALQQREEKDAVKTAEAIEGAIKETAGDKPTVTSLSRQIKELAREYVKAGADTVEALETRLHEFFEPLIPGVTKAELRNEFSDYGKSKAAPTEPLKVRLSQLRQESQKVSQLEALEKAMAPLRTGTQRVEQSARARDLQKKINELKKQLGIVDGDPVKRLRSALEASEKRLVNAIADARYEMAKGARSVKTKTPAPTNERIESLRAELKTVRSERDALLGPREVTEAQRIEIHKRSLQRQIADYQERIDKERFEPKTRKPAFDISKDKELQRLTADRDRKQNEFKARQRIAERAQWSKKKKVWEATKSVADASANLATALDLSALRQGIFASVARPITAAKNIGQMIKAFVSEGAARQSEAEINLRENSKNGRYKQAGLELTPIDETSFTAAEENMGSRLAEKIPGVRPSNRAFKTFLNRMRADMFDAIAGSKDTLPSVEELKALGHFVNVATGRGNFGKYQGAVPLLGRVYWSPRLFFSRIQLLLGEPAWRGTGWTRKVIAKEYGKYLAGMSALYGAVYLAKLAGNDDWDVGTDPRSADFGKVVIGNTRVDPLGGLAQVMTLAGRLATGESKDVRGKVKEKGAGEVLGTFNRSKLSPAVGTLWDIVSRKQYLGQPTTIGSVARNFFVPLSLRDLPGDIKEEGLAKALAIWVANIFGISTRAYGK